MSKPHKNTFQSDMIRQLQANCWLLGKTEHYNPENEGLRN